MSTRQWPTRPIAAFRLITRRTFAQDAVRNLAVALVAIGVIAAMLPTPWDPAASALGPGAMVGSCSANSLAGNDDGSSSSVSLGFPINYFGANYTSLFVNNNGNVTFDAAFSSYSGLDLGSIARPILAPLFYDIDTRPGASAKAEWGTTTFGGRTAMCVQWNGVGHYNQQTSQLSNFQLLIVERSDTGTANFDIVFNYDRVATGTYVPAAGYAASNGTYYELPGSRVNGGLADANMTTGLIRGSLNNSQLGRYVFAVRGGVPPTAEENENAAKQDQTITFPALADVTFGAAPVALAATASSNLAVSYGAAGSCNVVGQSVNIVGAGQCTVTATQAGDATFAPAPSVARTFQIAPASATIGLTVTDAVYDGAAHAATVSTNPGGLAANVAVTYNGSGIAPTNAGTYAVVATLTNANYAATPATGSFTIAKADQTIDVVSPPTATFGDPDVQLVATATSGLPVTFSADGPCVVTGDTLSITGAGNCTVTAAQSGGANWNPATAVVRSVTVAKATQGVVIDPLGDTTFGAPGRSLSATAGSGLQIQWTTFGPCALDSGVLTATGAGTCTVTAAQAGNADWHPASSSITFDIARAAQTIDLEQLDDATYGDGPRNVVTSATSGLDVALDGQGACTTSGHVVTIVGAGECVLTAVQPGNGDWEPAPSVTTRFTVARAEQSIVVGALAPVRVGSPGTTLAASASSGLPVALTVTGVCRREGDLLVAVAAGSCTVEALQPGNDDYLPADAVVSTVRALPGIAVLQLGALGQQADGGERVVAVTTSPAGLGGVSVTYDGSPAPPRRVGSYRVVAALTNPDWVAEQVTGTLVVTAPPSPVEPVREPSGELPTRDPGTVTASVGGVETEVELKVTGPTLEMSAGGATVAMTVVDSDGTPAALDATGTAVLTHGNLVHVAGEGFVAGSDVTVWLFSEPTFLGTAVVGEDGTFSADVPVPASIVPGRHTLQLNGLRPTGESLSIALGVRVEARPLLEQFLPTKPKPRSEPASEFELVFNEAGADDGFDEAAAAGDEPTPDGAGSGDESASAAADATPSVGAAGDEDGARYPSYDPREHTDEAIDTQVAAFALLALAGSGAAAGASRSSRRKSKVKGSKLSKRKVGSGTAWGDTSITWRWPFVAVADRWSLEWPVKMAPVSPLAARMAIDGSYLRAMFGTGWLLMPLTAVALAVAALFDTGGAALPPAPWIMGALIVVGALDASAGVAAMVVFVGGVIVTGHATGADSFRTLLGVSVLWFAVTLIASKARPFTRPEPAETWSDRLARAGDWIVAPLLGALAARAMVSALPALAGLDLPIAHHADRIALLVIGALLLRLAIESVCAVLYPGRLVAVTPPKLPFSGTPQRYAGIVLRTSVFVFAAYAYLGNCWQLWVGAALFAVPQAIGIYEQKFPNSERFYRALPKGIVKVVTMMVVGTWFGSVVVSRIDDPESLLSNGFVIFALPGVLLGLAEFFGRDGEDRELSAVDYGVGAVLLIVGALIALGHIG